MFVVVSVAWDAVDISGQMEQSWIKNFSEPNRSSATEEKQWYMLSAKNAGEG